MISSNENESKMRKSDVDNFIMCALYVYEWIEVKWKSNPDRACIGECVRMIFFFDSLNLTMLRINVIFTCNWCIYIVRYLRVDSAFFESKTFDYLKPYSLISFWVFSRYYRQTQIFNLSACVEYETYEKGNRFFSVHTSKKVSHGRNWFNHMCGFAFRNISASEKFVFSTKIHFITINSANDIARSNK